MQKVVITGATSLIGLAIINQMLENNKEIYAIIRPNSERREIIPKSNLIHVIECDLCELENLNTVISEECDTFYHIGWSHTGRGKYLDMLHQVRNIEYTISAVRVAVKLGCKMFIGAGSQAEYGPMNVERISPSSPTNPCTAYGVSKLAAGKLARLECDTLGIKCIWVRIFSTYGINDKPDLLMGSLIQKMKNNEHISMTEGIQQWDYLFSSDAGKAFYLIGVKCQKSGIYCLGSGKKRMLREYVDYVANVLGYDQKIGYGEVKYTENSVMNLCADIDDLSKDTGFFPEVSFEIGINKLMEYLGKI